MSADSQGDGTAEAIKALVHIMRALRDPDHGCPWDQRQDFHSIAPFTVEEAYEVADAIAREDMIDLRDELGDLLLQVVYHAQMADEQSAFDLGDVIRGINAKMIRRHPHVFGANAGAMDEQDVKDAWERIKREERVLKQAERERLETQAVQDGEKSSTLSPGSGKQASTRAETRLASALDGIALNLPALSLAEKVQKRAAQVGFDWPDIEPVWTCLQNEIKELSEAVSLSEDNASLEDVATPSEAVVDELGDVLFSVVNLARHLGLDSEQALRQASAKFANRFRSVEAYAANDGVSLDQLSLEALDELWQHAKR